MLPSTIRLGSQIHLLTVLVIAVITTPIHGSTSEKLDESSVPGTPNTGIKCSACSSCGNPCSQVLPPPPPPPPSPPPPSENPSKQYCPPPPPPPFFYLTGPPGNLYPFEPYYSGIGRNSVVGLPVLVGCGLLGLLTFLRL